MKKEVNFAQLLDFSDWFLEKIAEFHGCTTGDCPHETKDECSRELVIQFAEDQGIDTTVLKR